MKIKEKIICYLSTAEDHLSFHFLSLFIDLQLKEVCLSSQQARVWERSLTLRRRNKCTSHSCQGVVMGIWGFYRWNGLYVIKCLKCQKDCHFDQSLSFHDGVLHLFKSCWHLFLEDDTDKQGKWSKMKGSAKISEHLTQRGKSWKVYLSRT